MPTKRRPGKPSEPPWQVILEEIRSQGRATIAAIEAARTALEQRVERFDREVCTRTGAIEMALGELGLDVRQLCCDVKVLQSEVRGLGAEIGALASPDRSGPR